MRTHTHTHTHTHTVTHTHTQARANSHTAPDAKQSTSSAHACVCACECMHRWAREAGLPGQASEPSVTHPVDDTAWGGGAGLPGHTHNHRAPLDDGGREHTLDHSVVEAVHVGTGHPARRHGWECVVRQPKVVTGDLGLGHTHTHTHTINNSSTRPQHQQTKQNKARNINKHTHTHSHTVQKQPVPSTARWSLQRRGWG